MKKSKFKFVFALLIALCAFQPAFSFDYTDCHTVACNEVAFYESVYPDATARELELVYTLAYGDCQRANQ
ncbi:hypothetical protein [Flagellimonas lutaonensis]|uniref:Secreted protein n=1 Tax=Flagellimonas lutaonensis TaxID=516051 RepID=A0A0D5YQN3_9FLAO|nr:hypothetical protein [Allomuricauda lutaonensis]AKA34562.1 hypothetical protein VC82_912 [Allomuricauda lutaonensis]